MGRAVATIVLNSKWWFWRSKQVSKASAYLIHCSQKNGTHESRKNLQPLIVKQRAGRKHWHTINNRLFGRTWVSPSFHADPGAGFLSAFFEAENCVFSLDMVVDEFWDYFVIKRRIGWVMKLTDGDDLKNILWTCRCEALRRDSNDIITRSGFRNRNWSASKLRRFLPIPSASTFTEWCRLMLAIGSNSLRIYATFVWFQSGMRSASLELEPSGCQ